VNDMKKYLSETVRAIAPSGIRKFFDIVAKMDDVISLGVGEPDFVTPWHIREAALYSLEKGYTMYTSNQGLPELREEIARFKEKKTGLRYSPEKEVLVTIGVSEAVDLAFRALLAPGDEVLIPEPSYVSYAPGTVLASGKAVPVPTYDGDQYKLKAENLEACVTGKSKILVLAYPSNPTGAIMTKSDLEALLPIIIKNDLLVLSDEIYGELTYYEEPHVSIAALPGMKERTIMLDGFSKAYAMTGWRIGYVCAHADFIGAMNKIHQYTIMCAPIMGQKAAVEALRNGDKEMRNMVENYDYRRKLMLNGFRSIGLSCFEPQGAFYCFPDISVSGMNSEEFCQLLLEEKRVAAVPGNVFGVSGEGFARCCYAASVADIEEAIDRMGSFLRLHSREAI
jgi:aminotransferase